jgi:hypothetical protein
MRFMDIKLPHEIAKEVGYKPESNMIAKINRGDARPSPDKCKLIIRAMKERGVKISLFDLRPDLREVVMESL